MKLLSCAFLIFSYTAQGAVVERDFPAVVHKSIRGACDYSLEDVTFDRFPVLRSVFVSFGNCSKYAGACDEVGFTTVPEIFLDYTRVFVVGLKAPYKLNLKDVASENLNSLKENCKPRTFKIFFEE